MAGLSFCFTVVNIYYGFFYQILLIQLPSRNQFNIFLFSFPSHHNLVTFTCFVWFCVEVSALLCPNVILYSTPQIMQTTVCCQIKACKMWILYCDKQWEYIAAFSFLNRMTQFSRSTRRWMLHWWMSYKTTVWFHLWLWISRYTSFQFLI